jgi:hypothetical protein
MPDTEIRNEIIMKIAGVDKLVTVMRNSYGNYVVQKALYLSSGEIKLALADAIYSNIPEIQDKKIRTKWAQLLHKSVANDYNLQGRYNIEQYLQDDGVKIAGFENLQSNGPADLGFNPQFQIERKSMSPPKGRIINQNNAYGIPPAFMQNQLQFSPSPGPMYYNHQDIIQQNHNMQGTNPSEFYQYYPQNTQNGEQGYNMYNGGFNPNFGNHN